MSFIWEKSGTWRWIVTKTRDSKPFFFTFATVCGVIPGLIGYGVMTLTSSRSPDLEAKLRQTARPDSTMMGKVNKARLAEYLGEIQRKENTNDRYVAALRGETLTRNPYVRIQPVAKPDVAEVSKEAKPVVAETSKVAKPGVAEVSKEAKPVVAEASKVAKPGVAEVSKEAKPVVAEASKVAKPGVVEVSKEAKPVVAEAK